MDYSLRNTKVALSRWQKVAELEKNLIRKDNKGLLLKVALCGFLAGDGSVQARRQGNSIRYQIDFFPDDELMVKNYLKAMMFVYKKEPSAFFDGSCFNVRITSKTIAEDLLSIASFGHYTWTIPESLFCLVGAKETWLKAFFSSEAYVGKDCIRIQTVNKNGMTSVSRLLSDVGIYHTRFEYYPKKEKWSPVYIISINRIKERRKFLEKVGFWHEKKMVKLQESVTL